MPYTRAQIQESRAEGRKLTTALSNGWRPEPMRTPIQLQPNEDCYAQGNMQIWQLLEGDGTYVHKSRGGFGLLGLAVVAGTAAGNSARKSRAARQAAPRFRPIEQGPFFLTNMRFAVQGQSEWVDLWFQNIRMSSCDGTSITVHIVGAPPTQLHMWPVDYYFALYHFLANGDIIEIPDDPN
jgi:hypothetical protein